MPYRRNLANSSAVLPSSITLFHGLHGLDATGQFSNADNNNCSAKGQSVTYRCKGALVGKQHSEDTYNITVQLCPKLVGCVLHGLLDIG